MICRFLFLLMFGLSATATAQVNIIKLNGENIPLKKGDSIRLFQQSKTYMLQVDDSVWFIVEGSVIKNLIRLDQKEKKLDSLNESYKLLISLQEQERALYERQLKIENAAFDSLRVISQKKFEIAQEGIDALKRGRVESIVFATFLGGLAGALWMNNSDEWIKPVGLAAGALVLSIKLGIGSGGLRKRKSKPTNAKGKQGDN